MSNFGDVMSGREGKAETLGEFRYVEDRNSWRVSLRPPKLLASFATWAESM